MNADAGQHLHKSSNSWYTPPNDSRATAIDDHEACPDAIPEPAALAREKLRTPLLALRAPVSTVPRSRYSIKRMFPAAGLERLTIAIGG
jgi:hypothetical protein